MWERVAKRYWWITIPVVAVVAVALAKVDWTVAAAIGIAAGVAVLGVPALVGSASRRSRAAGVAVELGVDPAEVAFSGDFERLSLAERNGLLAMAVAQATGTRIEEVVDALPELLGERRVGALAAQPRADRIRGQVRSERIDHRLYGIILDGEIDLAARAAGPRTPEQRAMAEGSVGLPVDQTFLRARVEATRLLEPNRTIRELADDALEGRADLASVVGAIRELGRVHSAEWDRLA